MPAFIMSFDKILFAAFDKEIKEQFSVNQHEGREKYGINNER